MRAGNKVLADRAQGCMSLLTFWALFPNKANLAEIAPLEKKKDYLVENPITDFIWSLSLPQAEWS